MRPRTLALVLLLAVFACSGDASNDVSIAQSPAPPTAAEPSTAATTAAVRAPGCDKASPAGSTVRTVMSDGISRSFRVFVPDSYRADRPTPVVLNFHGFAGIALDQEAYAGMPEAAQRYGFIAVAPDGSGNPQRWWLSGENTPGYVDDFAFTRRLLDDLASAYCVDPARVFAAGISNGGFFSSLLACRLNDRIAAIATVAGEGFPDEACEGKKPVPVLIFHGTEDATVPFEPPPGRRRAGITTRSTRDTAAAWAAFNGCSERARTERAAADVELVSYGGCRGRADVQLYVVEGGGHSWPGAAPVEVLGHTTQSINATDLMWRFFAAHPRG